MTESKNTATSNFLKFLYKNYQGFPKRYYQSILVKVFQSYKPTKFSHKKVETFWVRGYFFPCSLGNLGSIPGRDKIWIPTALQHMGQNEWLVLLLKAIMYICSRKKHSRLQHCFQGILITLKSNLISYHKMAILPVSFRLIVCICSFLDLV